MTIAVSIGCYRLPQFVELCARRVRCLFGDVPIVLSDDLSAESPDILSVADRLGCAYSVGKLRRSHFSGDIQAVINALVLAEQTESDVAVKISQRFIPVRPAFREAMEREFSDPNVQIAVPGQIPGNQIARPKAKFYARFGILTDVVAIRRGAVSPEELMEAYRARAHSGRRADSLVEVTFGWLIANKLNGRAKLVPEWTRHTPMQPKVFLRKSQSTAAEYAAVAAMEGVTGTWDLREWGQIEQMQYMPRANQV